MIEEKRKNLRIATNMDNLQDIWNLNPRGEIQPVNAQEDRNGQLVHRQLRNNNIIHMAGDKDRVIRDYTVLTPQATHSEIVRPEVQADNFKLKLVMFQMLQTVGTF